MIDRDEFEASPPTVDQVRGVFKVIGASGAGSAEVGRRLYGRASDGSRVRQWLSGSRKIGFWEWATVLCIAMQLKVGEIHLVQPAWGEDNAPTP